MYFELLNVCINIQYEIVVLHCDVLFTGIIIQVFGNPHFLLHVNTQIKL